jgi:hypothetical protein
MMIATVTPIMRTALSVVITTNLAGSP